MTVDYADASTWEEYDVTEMVKKFMSGTSNYGFLIIPDEAVGNTGRNYISSDNTDLKENRPKLTITYETTAIINSVTGFDAMTNVNLKRVGNQLELYVPYGNFYQIYFSNASGQTIKTIKGNGKKWYSLNCDDFSKGLYFISVVSISQQISAKYLHID